jgi:hypothetical protein
VSAEETYLTVADAALWFGKSERTIRRWMGLRLLAVYRRGDGKLVLGLAELTRVEKAQRNANPVRRARRAEMFAQVASMTYSRD